MTHSPEHLFAAHHPDKTFLTEQCLHYYSNVISIASTGVQPGQQTVSYQHSHDDYEFLIPYGPIPMLILKGQTYYEDWNLDVRMPLTEDIKIYIQHFKREFNKKEACDTKKECSRLLHISIPIIQNL